ncbi:MAG: LuxR C-terminal-related transcriptional regulator [Janthinobacterium lividum]
MHPTRTPPAPADLVLGLAGALATAGSLTRQVDATLPVLADLGDAGVVVFAVAGSRAAGVRCWPPDRAWAAGLRDTFAASWEVGPLTLWCREVGVVPAIRVQDVFPGWGTEPGLVLEHGGQVLRELLVIPVARTGATIAAYFVVRHERPFDDDELARVCAVQTAVVASHGRFLRPPDPALTARQQDVLRLLAEGRTVRAIGSRLGISQSTVDKHVRDLYRRLGTQDRGSTVRTAQVRGLLDGLVGEAWQDLLIVDDP